MTKNRLQHERSPYLQQHAENPVDWYPWGEEAFEKATKEGKLIFLSIGYSACHWCHVMEHESFSDPETAEVLSKYFVSIKVDREERPDIDQTYQLAYQILHQRGGGWPLSMFLMPDKRPFFGGTYFPPQKRYGMPSFREILHSLQDAFSNRRQDVAGQAEELTYLLQQVSKPSAKEVAEIGIDTLGEVVARILQRADPVYGGTKGAPKFPNTMMMDLVAISASRGNREPLRHFERTLHGMYRGGMYDHLGGGFARYSTDEKWLVPHFEKMLYDNAQLSRLYVDGYRLDLTRRYAPPSPNSGEGQTRASVRGELHARVIKETLSYITREMTSAEGIFYSAQDADSEGEEGKFFAWTPKQIAEAVGFDDAEIACALYNVTDAGNFEHGKSVLSFPRDITEVAAQLKKIEQEIALASERIKEKLFAAREKRVKPFRDEKCLASWNGTMISSFAEAGLVFQNEAWSNIAQRALQTWKKLAWRDGQLAHAIKDGEAYGRGFLDDYAGLALAGLDVFTARRDPEMLSWARQLIDAALSLFWDDTAGDFFYTPSDGEVVLFRPKEPNDNAYPGGVGMMALAMTRLFDLTREEKYRAHTERLLLGLSGFMKKNPLGLSTLVRAVDYAARGPIEIIIAGDWAHPMTRKMQQTAASFYLPHRVMVIAKDEAEAKQLGLSEELFVDRRANADGSPNVYVCRNQTCEAPVQTPEALAALL